MKEAINKELKASKCMQRYCDNQSELFSQNYGKFYCEEHMLQEQHSECCIPFQDLDKQFLDSDLEMLKEQITSFYVSLSSVTGHSNEEKLSTVNAEDPAVDVDTLVNKLDISDEMEVTEKILPYSMLDKFDNLKRVLRTIKGNQGTLIGDRKLELLYWAQEFSIHIFFGISTPMNMTPVFRFILDLRQILRCPTILPSCKM